VTPGARVIEALEAWAVWCASGDNRASRAAKIRALFIFFSSSTV
jgi:hypothetical protein